METLKTRKILLVDDDQSIRLSLSSFFRKKCRAFVCWDRAEPALEHLRQEGCDFILCDYQLPGMDGLTFFRELHRLRVPAFKILITGFGSLELAIEAIKTGVHDFIAKPFNARTLVQSLTGLMAKPGPELPGASGEGKTPEEMPRRLPTPGKDGLIRLHHKMNNLLQRMLGNADMGLLESEKNNSAAVKRFDNIIRDIEQMMVLAQEMHSVTTFNNFEKGKDQYCGTQ